MKSITGGLLLSQLLKWFSVRNSFYRMDKNIIKKTYFTKDELYKAKNEVNKLPFINLRRGSIPTKTLYKIDWNECEIFMKNFTKEKSHKKKKLNLNPQIKKIKEICQKYEWPKGTKNQLEDIIEISLKNYIPFRKRYQEFIRIWGVDFPENKEYIKYINSYVLSFSPVNFVKNWILIVNNYVASFKNWRGDLHSYSFRKSSKLFHRIGREKTEDYCGDSKRWDTMMRKISN